MGVPLKGSWLWLFRLQLFFFALVAATIELLYQQPWNPYRFSAWNNELLKLMFSLPNPLRTLGWLLCILSLICPSIAYVSHAVSEIMTQIVCSCCFYFGCKWNLTPWICQSSDFDLHLCFVYVGAGTQTWLYVLHSRVKCVEDHWSQIRRSCS